MFTFLSVLNGLKTLDLVVSNVFFIRLIFYVIYVFFIYSTMLT